MALRVRVLQGLAIFSVGVFLGGLLGWEQGLRGGVAPSIQLVESAGTIPSPDTRTRDQLTISQGHSSAVGDEKSEATFDVLFKKITDQASFAQLRKVYYDRIEAVDRDLIESRFPMSTTPEDFSTHAEAAFRPYRDLVASRRYWIARTSLDVDRKEQPMVLVFSVSGEVKSDDLSGLMSRMTTFFPALEKRNATESLYQLGAARKREGKLYFVQNLSVDGIEHAHTHIAVEFPLPSGGTSNFESLGAVSKKWTVQRGLDWTPISEEEATTIKAESARW